MIARLMPTARAMSSIWASRTPRSSKSRRVAEMISASRTRRRAAAVPPRPAAGVEGSALMGLSLGMSSRREVGAHLLDGVGLAGRLVVAVADDPGKAQRDAAGVAGGALEAVEGDLD